MDAKKPKDIEEATKHSLVSNNDLYHLVQMQQNTINRLTQELTKRSHNVSRELYEKALNELENEKYEHSKTKIMLSEAKTDVDALKDELDYFKNELEKERCAYGKVLEFLKEKCLSESDKAFELVSKIAESEIRYKDAINDMNQQENKMSEMCHKVRQRERECKQKMDELNLKSEQEKYINNLLNEKSKTRRK